MLDASPYCFISYSRRDTALARWVQQRLESYKYPVALVTPELRPADPTHLRPVFLDTSDLPTSSGTYWDDICARLDASRYLLVLCSRAAAASTYVDREIARFIGGDESRVDRIVLAIVDPAIRLTSPAAEDFPPQILQRWQRLSARNHPVLVPKTGSADPGARKRGLMQVVSFMLGIEWTVLHNRYLIQQRAVLRRVAGAGMAVLAAISLSLGWALWKESELTTFERKVFPYSLVVGYVENFLSPLITALEAEPNKPLIIIALPESYDDLDHNRRVQRYREHAAQAGYGAELKKVKTSLPRGAETALIVPTPPYFKERQMEVYVDFASTVVAFRHVIEYKKRNAAYAKVSENRMLIEYAEEFEKSVLQELRGSDKRPDQRGRVVFVRSPDAALRLLAGEQ